VRVDGHPPAVVLDRQEAVGVEQPKDSRQEQLKARYVASDQSGYPPAYR